MVFADLLKYRLPLMWLAFNSLHFVRGKEPG